MTLHPVKKFNLRTESGVTSGKQLKLPNRKWWNKFFSVQSLRVSIRQSCRDLYYWEVRDAHRDVTDVMVEHNEVSVDNWRGRRWGMRAVPATLNEVYHNGSRMSCGARPDKRPIRRWYNNRQWLSRVEIIVRRVCQLSLTFRELPVTVSSSWSRSTFWRFASHVSF